MRPSYYICGSGSHINCSHFDDINGCWHDEIDAFVCSEYLKLDRDSEDEEDEYYE